LKESVVSWKTVGTSLKRLERCSQEGKTALGKGKDRCCSCKNNPIRSFKDEITNAAGTLSMANTGTPESGESQFFINVKAKKEMF
jgi:cyclophilin family peptidyl-prolyl cis-trans isomerase